MSREGVAAASTRRVAAEAGVPQSMIHYVFGKKNQLIRAVVETVSARLIRALSEVPPTPDWEDQIHDTVESVWDIVAADPAAALFVMELMAWALRDPELRDLADDLHRVYYLTANDAVRRLRQANSRTSFRLDSEEMASLCVCAINGLIVTFLVHGDRERSRRELVHLIGALTQYDVSGPAPVDSSGAPYHP